VTMQKDVLIWCNFGRYLSVRGEVESKQCGAREQNAAL
jgi:hypothetical protein